MAILLGEWRVGYVYAQGRGGTVLSDSITIVVPPGPVRSQMRSAVCSIIFMPWPRLPAVV